MDELDESKALKFYVLRVLKLQSKYGWMIDSYVLDFFTQGLWQRLSSKWTDVLEGLNPKEIAQHFFEMYRYASGKEVECSEKLTFRKVWPLELLAFLATCHSLNLQNQLWASHRNRGEIHSEDTSLHAENTLRKNRNETTDLSETTCSAQGATHVEEKLELKNSLKVNNINEAEEHLKVYPHCMNLSHVFLCNVKPKKRHEISILAEVICKKAEELQCWNIVDVGAGLGHLSRLLSYGYKFRVVTVEGDGCHKVGAEKLHSKLLNNLKSKQNTKVKQQANGSSQPTEGSLIHVTHHINTDISVEEFSNIISEAFGKMKDIEAQQAVADVYSSECAYQERSFENFIIVGLHTCGDLASTLLRVYCQCKNAVAVVLVGCCYMKLTHEMPGSEQPLANSSMNCHSKDNSNCSCLKTLGFPMSKYLKSCSAHQQSYNGLEAACHALDRYHKKLLEFSPSLKLHYYRALLEFLLQQKNPSYVKRQIRHLKTKKAIQMTFEEYVKNACEILGIEDDGPSIEDVRDAEKLHEGKQYDVVIFYVLRLLLAPLIEGLILIDRLLFIKENYPNFRARISMLFDKEMSPRNMAIIAKKILVKGLDY